MIGIIGGGISGLATARRLYELGKPFFLLEAEDRVGGVIQTVRQDSSWQLNYGANTLFVDENTLAFLERAGLGPDWLEPAVVGKDRFILQNGQYKKLPSTPPGLLFSDFFSWSTKLQILKELGNKELGPENESVYDFFARHFGTEVAEKAVQPFVGGIYAGDARELLMPLTFPNVLEMERQRGSVLRGFMKAGSGKRRKSISFLEGMSRLPDALAVMGRNVQAGQAVERIERVGERYRLHTRQGKDFVCSQVVIALPAYIASKLVQDIDPDLAARLNQVHYPELAQIHLGFKQEAISQSMKGFGGLHPPAEGTFTSGSIWVSSLFPMRTPMGRALLCTFAGGAGRPSIAGMSDAEVLAKATEEIRRIYGISAEPELAHLRRWERAIPQYDRHLLGLEDSAKKVEKKGIYFCANYIGGVSVAECLKKGLALAEQLKTKS